MSRTILIEGVPVRCDDREVLRALVQAAVPVDGCVPTAYAVAVRNEAGQIYRVVKLFGISEKARFARRMESLCFESDPTLGSAQAAGFDAIFSKAA